MNAKKTKTGDASLTAAAMPLDATQRQTIVQTDASDAAQADADAELDISPADRDELNRLAGEVLKTEPQSAPAYIDEFQACLFLAFNVAWAAMEIEQVERIPFELASFYRADPGAPDHAGLMHLKLKLKTALLPQEDPRRVLLALKLFRTCINGLDAIETEDREIDARAADAAAFKPAHDRLDGDGPFDRDGGRFERSVTGKSLDKQTT